MEKGKRSYMAEGVALFRAAHQIVDDEPRILLDPMAVSLLGEDAEKRIGGDLEWHARPYLVKARTLAVLRSRYTEDELQEAIERGVTQYVILGAGLDTSPYRPGHPAEGLQTFEIDHPDTQRWKLERLADAGIRTRENLRHIAVDFESQSLARELAANGFDREQPAFFSWLGVLYYLERESVFETFDFVGGLAAGSQLVMDFVLDDASLDESERDAVRKVSAFVESRSEPWLTRFSPGELADVLRAAGFNEVTWFNRQMATERYLRGRSDGLALDVAIQLMSAVI